MSFKKCDGICKCRECLLDREHPYKKQLEILNTISMLYSLKRRSKKDKLLGIALCEDILNLIAYQLGTIKCPPEIYRELEKMLDLFNMKRRDTNKQIEFINSWNNVVEFFRYGYDHDYDNSDSDEFLN